MKLKSLLVALVSAGLGFGVALFWMNGRQAGHHDLEAEKTSLASQSATTEAATAPEFARTSRVATKQPAVSEEPITPAKRSLQDILDELATIQVTPGPGQGRAQYRILALLDQLAQGGQSALPVIRPFLASNRDVAYGGAGRNSGRGGQGNAMLPPSLRFGLFDVVRQIGGSDAEQILAESLTSTARGTEFAYLTQLLEELAPAKYRDTALAAARTLLASGKISDAAERNSVYDILQQFKDTSFVTTAQANLVQADGKVDRSALRYLQQSLGDKSLAVAAQTYSDGRVTDSESKEALGRLALNFVGATDKALELYHKAALDPQLTEGARRNLIEDLNDEGYANYRNPTPEDVKLMAKRYELTQAYLGQDYVKNDKVLNESFLEANKDLRNMLQKAGVTPSPNPP